MRYFVTYRWIGWANGVYARLRPGYATRKQATARLHTIASRQNAAYQYAVEEHPSQWTEPLRMAA